MNDKTAVLRTESVFSYASMFYITWRLIEYHHLFLAVYVFIGLIILLLYNVRVELSNLNKR
jgi:hypothetical protein